jgi:hypothetical protein
LWIDHSGDQDHDLDGGHFPRRFHQPEHLAAEDGVVVFDGDFLERPQGQALLPFHMSALEVPHMVEEHEDGVHRGERVDVCARGQDDFEGAIANRPNRNRSFARDTSLPCGRVVRVRHCFDRAVSSTRSSHDSHRRAAV